MDTTALAPYLTVLAVAVPATIVARRIVRRWMLAHFTGVLDVANLGSPRKDGKIDGTAVICGGSIGGLLTARVLGDHFTRVVVVEPEAWTFSDDAAAAPAFGTREVMSDAGSYATIAHKRSRVYQYTAIHVYQVLLTRVLRALFPTFDTVAAERGIRVQPGDMGLRFSGWGFRPPYKEYGGKLPEVLYTSRRNLEAALRTLVRSTSPSIEYIQGTATALVLGPGNERVDAVRIREGDSERDISCVLAVDCTGASQVGLKLLARALPQFSTKLSSLRQNYDPQMNYVTLELPTPPGFEDALTKLSLDRGISGPLWSGPWDTVSAPWWLVHAPDPDVDYRAVFVGRCERGIVYGAGGWASDLPVTLDQIREYAKGAQSDLPVPQLFFDIVDLCEPVKDEATVFEARINSCSRIKYDLAADILPRNFIALGDATMRLNPRFGEGVTKVALGVTTLDAVLRRHPGSDIGPAFFTAMAPRTQGLWDAARFTDYGRSTTTPVPGESLSDGAFQRWFKTRLNRVLARDDAASSALWHNVMYLAPPLDLMAPSIVVKVLWEAIFPTAPFVRRA